MAEGDPKKLSDLLRELASESKFKDGLQKQQVYNAFDYAIGKSNAASVLSHSFSRGTLRCAIGSSVLRSELYPSLETIRKSINAAIGEELVKKIILQ
jgi:hypothetical protein